MVKRLLFLALFILIPFNVKAQSYEPVSPTVDMSVGYSKSSIRVYSGWHNYFDGRNWNKIDLMPTKTVRGIEIDKAPYTLISPESSLQSFIFSNDGLFDKKTNSVINSPSYDLVYNFLEINDVKPESENDLIVYYDIYNDVDADLVLKPKNSGVDFLLRINKLPSKKSEVKLCFTESYSGTKKNREIIIKDRIAYDSSEKVNVIKLDFKNGCKIVPYSFLETAKFPVYADDSVSVDGGSADQVLFSSGDWSQTYAGNSEDIQAANSDTAWLQATTAGTPYQATVFQTIFPTGVVIETGSTIDSASLFLYFAENAPASSRTYDLVRTRNSLPFSGGSTVWDSFGDSGFGAGTVYGSYIYSSGVAGYKEFVLSDFGQIAIGSGNTQFGILDHLLWTNTTPTTAYGGTVRTGDHANHPYIEIVFTPPAPPASSSSSASGSTSGTGSLTMSGTIITHYNSCSHYVSVSSGTTLCSSFNSSGACVSYKVVPMVVCDQWTAETEIPFLRFIVDSISGSLINVLLLFVTFYIIYKIMRILLSFVFKVLSFSI